MRQNIPEANQNGSNKQVFDCTNPICKSRLSFDRPRKEIINTPRFSSLFATHEQMSKCPNCGQSYCFTIEAVNVRWGMMSISEEQRRQIEGSEIIQL